MRTAWRDFGRVLAAKSQKRKISREDLMNNKRNHTSWLLTMLAVFLGLGLAVAQQPASQPEQQSPSQPPAAQQPDQQAPAAGQQQQQEPPSQTPNQSGQQQAPDSQAQSQTSQGQMFSGTIVKSGDKYVLQDASGTSYDVDHQELVKKYEGKQVRINGTLDPDGKTIHVK
jgi:cytoskeletal protein RodZ